MLHSSLVLTVVAIAAGLTLGTPVQKRAALTCSQVPPLLSLTTDQQAAVTKFCPAYLGYRVATSTFLTTPTITRTTTVGLTTSAQTTIVPSTLFTYTETTATVSSTTTQPSSTTTALLVSTAYLDNSGSTIAIMKRDAKPTNVELAKRAAATPPFFSTLSRADLVITCTCYFKTPPPPVVRTLAARPFVSIATKFLPRTLYSKTTQILTSTTATQIDLRTNVVTLIAPTATVFQSVYIQSQDSCPPNYVPTFLCPEDTAPALLQSDINYDPNYISCGVVAPDSYTGLCQYWTDDGQPAGSTLVFGDGSGDATHDLTRAATYGTAQGDDCPFWSDYTCASTNGQTTLTAIPHAKRTATPKLGTSASKTYHVKQTMPKAIVGVKGAHYRCKPLPARSLTPHFRSISS